jgi:hypothetical protein
VLNPINDPVSDGFGHGFGPPGRGIDMAMAACLVAFAPKINLECFDFAPSERITSVAKFGRKCVQRFDRFYGGQGHIPVLTAALFLYAAI